MSSNGTSVKSETPIDSVGDAIVAAMTAGGIDHLFFTSGSEIGFYQEAIAKARAHGHNNPLRLVTVPLEHVSLNAALGYAAVSGKPVATAAHVDCGTLHYGGAIHTAWRSGLPVVMTAGFPPTAASGSMHGARDEGGHCGCRRSYDQSGIVRNYTKWTHQLAYQDNAGVITSRAHPGGAQRAVRAGLSDDPEGAQPAADRGSRDFRAPTSSASRAPARPTRRASRRSPSG